MASPARNTRKKKRIEEALRPPNENLIPNHREEMRFWPVTLLRREKGMQQYNINHFSLEGTVQDPVCASTKYARFKMYHLKNEKYAILWKAEALPSKPTKQTRVMIEETYFFREIRQRYEVYEPQKIRRLEQKQTEPLPPPDLAGSGDGEAMAALDHISPVPSSQAIGRGLLSRRSSTTNSELDESAQELEMTLVDLDDSSQQEDFENTFTDFNQSQEMQRIKDSHTKQLLEYQECIEQSQGKTDNLSAELLAVKKTG